MIISMTMGIGGFVASAAGRWDGTIAPFAGGTGTYGNPYQIADATQLAYLAQQVNLGQYVPGTCFELTANIDLSGKSRTPIGTNSSNQFREEFDGNGYSITGLQIGSSSVPDSSYSNAGLFGIVSINGWVNN